VSDRRIRCDIEVAVVTMDNPPVNAQDARFFTEMAETFDALSDREDVRAVVLTGAGRCFSAGVDIKSRGASRGPGASWQASRLARECFHSILECSRPVVAAINGPALGAGLAVAASCDVLIASERALLGLPEIDVGLLGGGRHAMRLFGHSRARRMMFTGYRVPGPELHRLWVVEDCVAPDDLLGAEGSSGRDGRAILEQPIRMRRSGCEVENPALSGGGAGTRFR